MADEYFDKPRKKAKYGTTMHDVEKRRARGYIICAIILIICGVLDVIFLMGIFGA
ncbi:hypothetical protein SAMN02910456_01882 [Ruminococcaceae bacterium YRB3002]|nr:hypothetical protein SAMN02910456_01882 [Ruminococcaceae bacterium YRB3002]